jgi:hypothetical protein
MMGKGSDIEGLAEGVKGLFEERYGVFRAENFVAVADVLGFEARVKQVAEQEIGETYHQEQQPGEGFWCVAPGAGDISEGMVWVSKKPTS